MHLELGNSFMQPPGMTKRIPLVMIGKSFYAKCRVLRPGHAVLRVAPVVEAHPSADNGWDDIAARLKAKKAGAAQEILRGERLDNAQALRGGTPKEENKKNLEAASASKLTAPVAPAANAAGPGTAPKPKRIGTHSGGTGRARRAGRASSSRGAKPSAWPE